MSGDGAVVVAVGNAYRSDDGAGLAVADRLRDRLPGGVRIVSCELEPSRLIDACDGAASAFVVDAVESGAAPGTLHRFDASNDALPARLFRSSTHAFGVADAIEVARALGRLPERVVVYGIEGAVFAGGEGLTDPVDAAVDAAVAALLADVARSAGGARDA